MARKIPMPTPSGLVQIVRLQWDKSARGGQGARERSAVPQSFAIPATELTGNSAQLHVETSTWSERNAFAEPFSTRRHSVAISEGLKYGCVSVSAHLEGLQVRFEYDQANGGAPDRWFFNCPSGVGELPGRILLVGPEKWVRVCYNGRFSCIDSGNWWYEQITINVAWFAGEPDGRVFVAREPSHDFRALADLW
jgi:hypothetical protein